MFNLNKMKKQLITCILISITISSCNNDLIEVNCESLSKTGIKYYLDDSLFNGNCLQYNGVVLKENKLFNRKKMQIFFEKNNIQTRTIFTGNILKQPVMKNRFFKNTFILYMCCFERKTKTFKLLMMVRRWILIFRIQNFTSLPKEELIDVANANIANDNVYSWKLILHLLRKYQVPNTRFSQEFNDKLLVFSNLFQNYTARILYFLTTLRPHK